jgi:hypothetical protein
MGPGRARGAEFKIDPPKYRYSGSYDNLIGPLYTISPLYEVEGEDYRSML